MAAEFDRFTPALFEFLVDISLNNNRNWFDKNRQRYEDEVRSPARAFIRAMAPRMAAISDQIVADDRKSGGSLMRIFRDIRFSKDKTPYKTNVGIQFRHCAGKDVHAPGFYLHLSPDEVFLGVGVWKPDGAALRKIRTKIDQEPERWLDLVRDETLLSHFSQVGDSLVRPPKGYSKDHDLIDELKRKDHILSCRLSAEEMTTGNVLDFVTDRFELTKPYCAFICEAIELPF